MAPRTARLDLRDKREKSILEAAAAVFAERGFRATRVADIAERAGIGKGTVYEYFRSKEDLFLRLFDWYTTEALAATLDELQEPAGSAVEALKHSSETLLASCQQMLPFYPLTMEFWSASTAPEFRDRMVEEFRELYRRLRGAFAGAIQAGIASGELAPHVNPEAVAAALVSAYDGLFLQAWFDKTFDPVASGRGFLDALLRGMATGREPTSSRGPRNEREGKMKRRATMLAIVGGLLLTVPCAAAVGAPGTRSTPDATSIVKDALDYWRDKSSFVEMAMTVHRPEWERKSLMESWTRGDKDALVRFVEPKKDAGSATLKVGDDMWIYTPRLSRVIKLPFSMMAQSWMGSDFSYNDLAKSDDLLLHFDNRIVKVEEQDGHKVYVIEATPHESAPVIWGKETVRIRDDHLLLEEVFFDQDQKPVKRLKAMEIAPLGGKIFVTRMRMETLEEAGHWTDLTYRRADFGVALPTSLFTLANLRNPRSQWERRP